MPNLNMEKPVQTLRAAPRVLRAKRDAAQALTASLEGDVGQEIHGRLRELQQRFQPLVRLAASSGEVIRNGAAKATPDQGLKSTPSITQAVTGSTQRAKSTFKGPTAGR